MRVIYALLAATILLSACNQYSKTKSGMPYKIIHGSSKTLIKQGDYVKFNVEYRIPEKDTLLGSTYGKMPQYVIVDTARIPKYNFAEVITECAVGDKIEFSISVDSLVNMKQIPAYDNLFKKGGLIKGKAQIIQVFKSEKDATADYQKEAGAEQQRQMASKQKEMEAEMKKSAGEQQKEAKNIEKYIADNKIKAVKSANGVFVEVQSEGTLPKADTGKQLQVMYKGYTLDGKVFDANMGPDAKHKEPFALVLGAHQVIPGWEEGLKYFGKGGKGRLIIPFSLAYGFQGSPPVIPPYATLVFEVEVKDITTPSTAKGK